MILAVARMRWLLFVIVFALGGCGGSPWGESEAQRKAEEAKNIFPMNYKTDLVAFMRTYLNDPTNIRGAGVSQPELRSTGTLSRFVACVRYNAKGPGGQYAGAKDNLAIFISGRLDNLVELSSGAEGSEEAVRNKPLREFCSTAVYQPFPELERLTR
jgi:hypothetical protein